MTRLSRLPERLFLGFDWRRRVCLDSHYFFDLYSAPDERHSIDIDQLALGLPTKTPVRGSINHRDSAPRKLVGTFSKIITSIEHPREEVTTGQPRPIGREVGLHQNHRWTAAARRQLEAEEHAEALARAEDASIRLQNLKRRKGQTSTKLSAVPAELIEDYQNWCWREHIEGTGFIFAGRSTGDHISDRQARFLFYFAATLAGVERPQVRLGRLGAAWPHLNPHVDEWQFVACVVRASGRNPEGRGVAEAGRNARSIEGGGRHGSRATQGPGRHRFKRGATLVPGRTASRAYSVRDRASPLNLAIVAVYYNGDNDRTIIAAKHAARRHRML